MEFPKDIRFQCQRCSRCCRHTELRGRKILLSDPDILRIEKNLSLKRAEFAETIEGCYPFAFLMKMVDEKCVFLEEDKTCKIYELRPLICRCYPFWIEREGDLFVFKATPDCPGLGKGNKIGEKYFRDLLSQAVEVYQQINWKESET